MRVPRASDMPTNIEAKAFARNFERQPSIATGLADGETARLRQRDSFYQTNSGRLKLRTEDGKPGQLIAYFRPEGPG
jgi:hypothetical protein